MTLIIPGTTAAKGVRILCCSGPFLCTLLQLHPLYDLQASLLYPESHLDQNSNTALFTNATKPTLCSRSILNFCLVTGRPQTNMMTISEWSLIPGCPSWQCWLCKGITECFTVHQDQVTRRHSPGEQIAGRNQCYDSHASRGDQKSFLDIEYLANSKN